MAVRVEAVPTPTKTPGFPPPIIEARGVDKTYDTGKLEVHALRDVTFSVPRGRDGRDHGPERLRQDDAPQLPLRARRDRRRRRRVIEGVSLNEMSDRQRTDYRARRMGFIFQFYNLMPVLSAVENVELPLLVSRVGAGEARRRALAALELVGLRKPRESPSRRALRWPATARHHRARARQRPGNRVGG